MRPKRLTGLAATAIGYRDKVAGTTDQITALRKQLEEGGEDYADASDQCDVICRALDGLSDAFVDLSVLILKADKVRTLSREEGQQTQRHDPENTEGRRLLAEQDDR